MIQLKGLHKYFNKGRQNEIHVINDVTLELPERGMTAIFGKSGCGKTTLLNVIGGLDGYAAGSLTIEGKDIRHDTDVIRNQYIGYIFQNYNLNKTETCFDNVADALRLCGMTDPREIERRTLAALANVGMEKYKNRTPDTLSGGQQQRIAIARAIVKNPPVILADEPTGNLDEANTVMIMDLLKAISKDHLVLLVTHEANLVDYYCDTVIELSDGQIINIKNNAAANGFAARDKNDIFLGELEKSEINGTGATVEYYGEAPETPIKLKIVNSGGKLYVKIDTPQVNLLDDFSEVKLREGVFEQKADQNQFSKHIDMSALPPVKGTKFGHLFSFRSALKSGYVSNFKQGKKGKKVLRRCMGLLAAVVVLMSALFGTVFADIINAKSSYNHNVFYVYSSDPTVSQELNQAVGNAESGIDYVRLHYGMIPNSGDVTVKFYTGFFETFSPAMWDESFRTNAALLDVSLTSDCKLVAGKKEGLATEEILISTAVADALLEKSSLGYITEYKDLIGLISNMNTMIDGKNLRIAGVVESSETAIYLTEIAMAKYVLRFSNLYVTNAGSSGLQVDVSEAVLIQRYQLDQVKTPNVGDKILIHGKEFQISKILQQHHDYKNWLVASKIQLDNAYTYFGKQVQQEHPEIGVETEEFRALVTQKYDREFYSYYDYYYTHLDAFLRDLNLFHESTEAWLYAEKGIDAAKYYFTDEKYYKAVKYKERYGAYPTREEFNKHYNSLPDFAEEIKPYMELYEYEFYNQNDSSLGYGNICYLLNDSDYVAISKQIGQTNAGASSYEINYAGAYEKGVSEQQVVVDSVYYGSKEIIYTVVHSNNADQTAAWLEERYGNTSTPDTYIPSIVTPDSIFDRLIEQNTEAIVTGLVTLSVVLVLMCICMYFIMRSSLMNRIKEVGIYRAIGVSKQNLIFKFFVEAFVLTSLTVTVGYLISSAFLAACLSASALVSEIFFYPPTFALILLGLLYAMGLFFGTLPILSLLRKTPSEILSKYDI